MDVAYLLWTAGTEPAYRQTGLPTEGRRSRSV